MRGYLRTSVHNNLHFLYSIHCSFSTLEQVYLISCYFEFQPSFYVLYHHFTARRLMDSNIKVGKLYVELINKPWENVCRIQTQFRIPLCKISTSNDIPPPLAKISHKKSPCKICFLWRIPGPSARLRCLY